MTNMRRLGYEVVTIQPSQDENTTNQPSAYQQITSLEQISWYHGELNRTTAETLLLQPDINEGTYLLRKSQRHDGFTVSVRCQGSVKHFVLDYNNRVHEYKFGNASFSSLQDILNHFESCPILTRDNDIPVTLIHPYNIGGEDEPAIYEKTDGHAEAGVGTFNVQQKQDTAIASKSGYLIKRGNVVKNWKERWFTSEKKSLKYFENRRTDKPIKVLDLSEATQVAEDDIDGKKCCFRVVFPQRTFYFVAKSPIEAKEWIDHFQWKIEYYKQFGT